MAVQQGPYTHHASSICGSVGTFCQALPLTNDELSLRVCTASDEPLASRIGPENQGALLRRTGAFVLERVKDVRAAGHDVYRVRLIGHEILLLETHVCNQSVVVAPYQVLIGGTYHIEFVHLFEHFTLNAHPEPVPQAESQLAEFDAMVVSMDETWGCAWDPTCPPCSGQEGAKGRWIARLPRLLGDGSACMPQAGEGPAIRPGFCGRMVRSIVFNKSAVPGVEWQPYTCRLARPDEIDMAACTHGRHYCFVGDSQMRTTMMGVTSLISGDTSWHEWDIPAGESWVAADKTVAGTDFAEYISDAFGVPPVYPRCTNVLMNFGQWPASGIMDGGFWPLQQYQLSLEVAGDFLLSLRAQGKRVYWVPTLSQPVGHTVSGISDWRSDALIGVYDQLSHAHFTGLDIPVFMMCSM